MFPPVLIGASQPPTIFIALSWILGQQTELGDFFFCMAYNRLWRSSLSETSKWDSPKCIEYRVHLWIIYSRDDGKTWPAIILTLPDNRQSFYPSEYKDYKPRARVTPVCVPFVRPWCCRADLISTSLRVNWIPIIVTFKVELTLFLNSPLRTTVWFFRCSVVYTTNRLQANHR